MKQILFMMTLMIASISFAKVSDFNALINENMKAQNALHKDVKVSGEIETVDLNKKKNPQIILVEGSDISVQSNPELLQFAKEKGNHKANRRAMKKRLADEFKSLDKQL